MDVARVRFYVRADGWAAWEALDLPAETLEVAFAELKDERLVAAYVLETLADNEAATSVVDAGQKIKRIKDGSEELEYFQGTSSADIRASQWLRRAQLLRSQNGCDNRLPTRLRSVVYQPELEA